jgi:hypothetical protein
VVNAENKKCARLNVIRHLLSMIPYKDLTPEPLKLPPIVKVEVCAAADTRSRILFRWFTGSA